MADLRKPFLAAVCGAASAAAVSWAAIHTGSYGWVLFFAAPFLLGFVSTAVMAAGEPRPRSTCLATTCVAAGMISVAFLVTAAEGIICLIMALPIAGPLMYLGSSLAYELFHAGRLPGPRMIAILLPLVLIALVPFEPDHRSPVYVAEDSIVVHASAERTWRTIVTLSDVRPAHGLLFRTGIACPQRTKIVAGRSGGLRVCTMSTGLLMERIDVWQPGRRLAWRAISTPPPMKELNPLADADPPHLHGYYRNVRGEFAIERLGPDVCRLTRRTWYSLDLAPASYWRIWCDVGAAKIQRFVLEEVKRSAEAA